MALKLIIKSFKSFFEKLVLKEKSPKILALSFCAGIYIAFCPFVGFHTVMVFAFSWFFSLNFAVTLASSVFVNNPWTMVPIYSMDYVFGDLFFKLFGINPLSFNPSWMDAFNSLAFKYTGVSGISFWSFMIGGNLLGIIISVILYPIARSSFEKISKRV
ncbi:MAG: hypothetical protein UR12_C0003G0021 [candidate division TM6 bacterium GW2011_GWF2_30_66]|nr:MAG: hypothetical protein UR12_C0003G0021 [candidate division TM6 bacterium GW2011_GWF2_30_66]